MDALSSDAAHTEIEARLISLRQWFDHWERYRSDWPTSESLKDARAMVDDIANLIVKHSEARHAA
jgi:hypothetical protein